MLLHGNPQARTCGVRRLLRLFALLPLRPICRCMELTQLIKLRKKKRSHRGLSTRRLLPEANFTGVGGTDTISNETLAKSGESGSSQVGGDHSLAAMTGDRCRRHCFWSQVGETTTTLTSNVAAEHHRRKRLRMPRRRGGAWGTVAGSLLPSSPLCRQIDQSRREPGRHRSQTPLSPMQ